MIFIRALGAALIDAGDSVVKPAQARKFAMLLYLSAERGRPVPRSTLLEVVFDSAHDPGAQHSLRELLYQLRQSNVRIATSPQGLELAADEVSSDFGQLIACERLTPEQLKAADGGFLPGYAPSLSEGFSVWLDAYRARITLDMCKTFVRELRRSRSVGDWVMTERAARTCLSFDPLNEEATLALAEALAIGGSKTQAVALLDTYMAEVGARSPDLKVPASLLKRRIAERLPERYSVQYAMQFVGRDEEMTILAERLARTRAGDAQCVALCGEPGIGKTRIASEFVTVATLDGARIARAMAQPHDVHRPMGAFVDLVPQLLQLPGALGCSPASMAALKRLTEHDPAVEVDSLAAVGHSEEVSAAITRAICDVVDAIAAETPLILWLEDAHWLDEMSLRVIATLTSTPRARRLLAVLTSRERSAVLARFAEGALVVQVGPLPPEKSRMLVDESLSRFASDEAAQAWVVDTAAGNPFFLMCLVSHMQQTGERFTVPPTISALLDQRMTALSPEAMTVLETCVLLGKYSTLERLVAIVELPHFRLLPALRELETGRMIAGARDRIQPSHWLIADSIRRAVAPIASSLTHRRIASLLENEARTAKSPAMLWDCGEHWVEAGDPDRAVEVMRECSRHAIEIGRPREGTEMLLRASELTALPLKLELLKEAVRSGAAAFEHELVRSAVESLRQMGEPEQHDDIEMADHYFRAFASGDDEQLTVKLTRCLSDPSASLNHRLQSGISLAMLCDQQQNRVAAEHAFRILRSISPEIRPEHELLMQEFLLIYHASFGDSQEAVRIAHELLKFDIPSSPGEKADIYRKAGLALWRGGSPEEGVANLEAGHAFATERGQHRVQFFVALMCSTFHSELGNGPASKHWLSVAERVADSVPAFRDAVEYIMLRADIASVDLDQATLRELYEKGMVMSRTNPNRRLVRWLKTMDVLMRYLLGERLKTADLHSLFLGETERMENGDAGDLEVAITVLVADQNGEAGNGRQILANYLDHRRRGQAPLHALLQKAAVQIWGEGITPVSLSAQLKAARTSDAN